MNEQFQAVIRIDKIGKISGNVYETDSKDIYFPLRVESMEAGFAGSVRAEYKKILEDIKNKCCHINYFISSQSNRLVQKIYDSYGDNPCFPWDKYADYGVFKNSENNKWYALIMTIDFIKIDKKYTGTIEVVNLKLSQDKIPILASRAGFYPAYHMNKKNWITIVLNDTITYNELFELLDESYAFTLKK